MKWVRTGHPLLAPVFLINERIGHNGQKQSWEEFVEANADLFDWKNNVLKTYYDAETLSSEFARRIFVLPDKVFSACPEVGQKNC